MLKFIRRSTVEAPADEVFAWHERPGALQRLTPPFEDVELIESSGGIKSGGTSMLEMKAGPSTFHWLAQHVDYHENQMFSDIQLQGPFAYWKHTHTFKPQDGTSSVLEDKIEYILPAGLVSNLVVGRAIRRKLERVFSYRHKITQDDLALYLTYKGIKPMKILVSGSSGLVGQALLPLLTTQGHEVTRLVRKKSETGIYWQPDVNEIDVRALEGFDAVIHLAGDNIADGRWTSEKKAKIRDSRIHGTKLLSQALAQLANPPKVLVSASAIGFYGPHGDESLDESAKAGDDFLAQVCRDWEASTQPAANKGIRVVNLRFGVILSTKGGALAKMLPPFLMGAGGNLGSGRQVMSWVSLDDVLGSIYHCLVNETIHGPVNVTSPNPATNAEFTKALGRVLHRPTVARVPSFGARLLFGEMADALLLSGARVLPAKLMETNYKFRHPDLEEALRFTLGK